MNSYYNFYAEKELDKWMPQFAINESDDKEIEYPVKDAPSVKGYFGFIFIKYMKRCKDIKKMCVEFINAYVDSCLNVAKNMDDVKLTEGITNLATELNFSTEGANTKGNQNADTKMGVAFLAGDKALKDKLQAIINKINLRASKNKLLKEWSELMIEESKIIANDIVFQESNKLIKDEVKRNELKKSELEKRKKAKETAEKKQEEKAKKIEAQTKSREQLGNFDGCNQGVFQSQKDVIDSVNSASGDFDKPMYVVDENSATDAKIKDSNDIDVNKLKYNKQASKLFSARELFYITDANLTNWKGDDVDFEAKAKAINLIMQGYGTDGKMVEGGNDLSKKINEYMEKISSDDEKTKVKGQIINFLYAVSLAGHSDCSVKSNEQTYPSPLDLMILKVNSQQISNAVKSQGVKTLGGVKEQDFQIGGNVKGDELIIAASKYGIEFDKDKYNLIAGEWISTFADDSGVKNDLDKRNVYPLEADAEQQKEQKANENYSYVMSSYEFINKRHYNKY